MKAGQKNADAILSNVMNETNVSPNFMEFLNALGWTVAVNSHAGWTGHVSTSWQIINEMNVPQPTQSEHGGSLYNGSTHVLYWADVSSEIAFVVPTQSLTVNSESLDDTSFNESCQGEMFMQLLLLDAKKIFRSFILCCNFLSAWFERSASESAGSKTFSMSPNTSINSPRTMSLDLGKQPSSIGSNSSNSNPPNSDPVKPRRTTKHSLPAQTDTKIMVVWLESLEDYPQFPIGIA